MRGFFVVVAVFLVSCGPIPLAQAETECFDRARLAQQPRGTVRVGVNSDGTTYVGGDVTVSSDYLSGADPSQVYDQCVLQKSGQMPSQPFYTLPGAQG